MDQTVSSQKSVPVPTQGSGDEGQTDNLDLTEWKCGGGGLFNLHPCFLISAVLVFPYKVCHCDFKSGRE